MEKADESFQLPSLPNGYGDSSISLSVLIDLVVSQIHREFHILTELLLKKKETDRKISISAFANSTRMVFIKLLAAVRWAKESENQIQTLSRMWLFLDQQAASFVYTANALSSIARAEMLGARLPFFQVSETVNILSLGSFVQLPISIKNKFIAEPELSECQAEVTLKWLSGLIDYRLIQEFAHIPREIAKIQVNKGMAVFTVPHEFKLFMTLEPLETKLAKFDNDQHLTGWRWKVHNVEVLISDLGVEFGSSLLNPVHKQKLLSFCNGHIKHEIGDIRAVHEALHDMIIRFQLNVFSFQAHQLSNSTSDRYVSVKVFNAKLGLLEVAYWLNDEPRKSTSHYRLTFKRDANDPRAGLKIEHSPKDEERLPELDPKKELPTFYSIFNKTILTRCETMLARTKQVFDAVTQKSSIIRLVSKAPLYLCYKILPGDCDSLEYHLRITSDGFSGRLRCTVKSIKEDGSELMEDLERVLNSPINVGRYDKLLKPLKKIQIHLALLKIAADAAVVESTT